MIKNLPPGFLHTPKKLQELVLMGNLFKEVPSDVLEESHDLKILNLNDNPIKVLSTERSVRLIALTLCICIYHLDHCKLHIVVLLFQQSHLQTISGNAIFDSTSHILHAQPDKDRRRVAERSHQFGVPLLSDE